MSTITFVLDTLGAVYLVELWYKLSVHNYFCPGYCRFILFDRVIVQLSVHNYLWPRYCRFILFGRVMVQIECPQLLLSSILSVHFIW